MDSGSTKRPLVWLIGIWCGKSILCLAALALLGALIPWIASPEPTYDFASVPPGCMHPGIGVSATPSFVVLLVAVSAMLTLLGVGVIRFANAKMRA